MDKSDSQFMAYNNYVSNAYDRFPLLVWKRILQFCSTWDYLEMQKFIETVNLPAGFLYDPILYPVNKHLYFHILLPSIMSRFVGSVHDKNFALDFKDISNCRLVCRSWNAAITNNVLNHVCPSQYSFCLHEWGKNFLWQKERRNHYANNCYNTFSRFCFRYHITEFLHHFGQYSDFSPFLCHHVRFKLTSPETSSSYIVDATDLTVASLMELFQCYGRHLRRIDLNLICMKDNGMDNLYPGVLNLIRLSPNLEALRLSRTSYLEDEDDDNIGFYKRKVFGIRFPRLKFLTNLEVDRLPYPIFNNIIISNGNHIEKLKISGLEGSSSAALHRYSALKRNHRMENLKELRISFDFATEKDIELLGKSAPRWKSLEKLYLDFEAGGSKLKSISWSTIIQCLNKFCKKSVTHLWLHFPKLTPELNLGPMHDYHPTREEKLKLVNLKNIALTFPRGCAFSIDFLRGLENLETLYIVEMGKPHEIGVLYKVKRVLLRRYRNDRGPEIINFKPEHESNTIWEKLPKLSKLYWSLSGKKYAWKKYNNPDGNSHAQLTTWDLPNRS